MSLIQLAEQAAPATPPADRVVIFVDASDGLVKTKDANGTVTVLGTTGLSMGFNVLFDNGATALATKPTIPFMVPVNCDLQEITLVATTIGTINIDVRRATYNSITEPFAASFTVVPSVKPSFTSNTVAKFNSLADGVVSVVAGQYLQIVINTCQNIPKLAVSFRGVRS